MGFKDLFSSDSDVLGVPPENRLDLAVTELSRYYMSVASENELANYGGSDSSSGQSDAESAAALRAQGQEVIRKIRSLIQDTSTGGLFATQILQKFKDDDTLSTYPYIDSIFKVKYESHTPSPVNATANRDNNQGVNAQCGSLRMPNPTQQPNVLEESAGITEPVQGGNAEGIPDAIDNPCLSAIVINDDRMTPGNNRNAAGALFFNSMPTIEMSQCSPFIKLTFITENDNFLDGAKRMSLYGFTHASDEGLSAWDALASQKGIDFNTLSLKRDNGFGVTTESPITVPVTIPGLGAGGDTEGDLSVEASRPSTTGIELFQSPQALNNAGNAKDPSLGGPLNPTAPLASLQRLSVDISGLGLATLCNKTAALEFILHDRSQMKLIAPIIGASSFAGTHVEIEFGWMHPQATMANGGNVYANFINSLRSKSLFNIQVADLSILEDGQVRVNLKLASRGAAEMASVPAASGVSKISAAMLSPFLNKVLSQMSHMKSAEYQSQTTTESENANASEVVSAAATAAQLELLDIQRGFSALSGFSSPTTMIDLVKYRELLSNLVSNEL